MKMSSQLRWRMPGRVCVSHLGQVREPPFRDDGSSPQVVDVDVVGGRGHGGFQVVVVAEGASGHSDGKLHPAHPRTLDGCGHDGKLLLLSQFLLLTNTQCLSNLIVHV